MYCSKHDPNIISYVLDWAQSSSSGQKFLKKLHKAGNKRFKMKWKKNRFLGKLKCRTDKEYRKLKLMFFGRHDIYFMGILKPIFINVENEIFEFKKYYHLPSY